MFAKTMMGILAVGLTAGAPMAARADVNTGVADWSKGDYAGAVHEWQGPADRGDPVAQYNLAQAYKWGKGVPQDLTKAELLFAKAAAQGHSAAADNYGLLLFQRGQHAQAIPYIKSAADHGEARAQYLLGIAYFNGENVPRDWVHAYALESLSNQQGLPQAKAALAQMDQFIPLDQRQKGVSLSSEMAAQIEANRSRTDTALDLGTNLAASAPPAVAQPATMPASSPAMADTPPPPTYTPPQPAPRHVAVGPQPVAHPQPIARPRPTPIATGGGWKLQLGAFSVAGNADALWAKVRGLPEIAGHARLNAPTGRVTRLMAGGYSEDGARAACRKLSAAGYTCLPARD